MAEADPGASSPVDPASPSARPSNRHRPGLDGLRGLAVVAVVAYHLDHLRGGFLGVDVFFVLSGFLITGLVLDEIGREGKLGLRAFWGRRIRRLVPALLLVVTVVVAVALAIGWPASERRALGLDGLATLGWWANWRQASGGSYWDSGESLFRHAWSLSIEEQFYLLWPLALVAVVALARRTGRSVAGSVAVTAAGLAAASATWSMILATRLGEGDLSRVYVGTDTRVVAPLTGCALAAALAVVSARRSGAHRSDRDQGLPSLLGRGLVVAAGLVGAVVLVAMFVTVEVSSPALYRSGGLVVAALAAAAVVRAASDAEPGDGDPLARAVTNPVAGYLGTRSYALYLWSWPVQVLVLHRWPTVDSLALVVVTVGVSLVSAELSFRFVEQPIRRASGWAVRPTRRRPAWVLGTASAFGVVALALLLASPQPIHQRIDPDEVAADALRPVETRRELDEAPEIPPVDPSSTASSTEAAPPLDVLVTGDSVAWTMGFYAPYDDLPDGIASIDSRALVGCGLLAGLAWEYPGQGAPEPYGTIERCLDQDEAEQIGLSARPDVVIVFPGSWEGTDVRSPDGEIVLAQSEEMRELLLNRLVDRIRAAHAVDARFAMFQWACPGARIRGNRAEPQYIRWINGIMAQAAAVGRREGARVDVIEPNDEVCVDADPFGKSTSAKDEATEDETHVASDEGGHWIWHRWLAPALRGVDPP